MIYTTFYFFKYLEKLETKTACVVIHYILLYKHMP